MSHSMSFWVGSLSRVRYLGNITIVVVGVVVNSLNTTVRKVDLIRTLYNPGTIVRLLLTEGSPRVFVSHTIIVGVRGDLTEVGIGGASVVSHSMYRGHSMYSIAILGSSCASSEEGRDVEEGLHGGQMDAAGETGQKDRR